MRPLTKPTDGPVARLINRRISIPITLTIVRLGIPLTPNQVSFISFMLGVLGGVFIALGHPIIGGILAQAASVIDGVDGELARLKNMASSWGAFLDTVLDRLADATIVIGLTLWCVSEHGYGLLPLLAGLLAVQGCILLSYVKMSANAKFGEEAVLALKLPSFGSRDVRLFVVFIGCLVGRPLETLILLAALSNADALLRFVGLLVKERGR